EIRIGNARFSVHSVRPDFFCIKRNHPETAKTAGEKIMSNNLPITNREYVLQDRETIVSKTDLNGNITYAN
ncbi:MAG: hypothetical protein ABI476_08150, partial [Oxalobacteraceae bacterium]